MTRWIFHPSPELAQAILASTNKVVLKFSSKRELDNQIKVGDLIYLRVKTTQIVGQTEVEKVISITPPSYPDILSVVGINQAEDFKSYFKQLENLDRYILVSIIYLTKVTRVLASPIDLAKNTSKVWDIV